MNLNAFKPGMPGIWLPQKLLLVVKITTFLLLSVIMSVSAGSFAQKITLSEKNTPLKNVLDKIRQQSGYDFVGSSRLIRDGRSVSIHVNGASLEDALDICFENQSLTYTLKEKTILVKEKERTLFDKIIARIQAVELKGKIVDESGHGLPGASVKIKGTNQVAVANSDGEFSLSDVQADAVLQFSHVGYLSREVPVKSLKNPLLIVMTEDIGNLDQVQVTAYGTTSKRLNAGDITTITAKDIEKNPVNNVLEALQGKVPGLFIQQVTGQPGGAFNLRLRGSANFGGATQPLIVVDGVRYPGSTLPLSTNTSYATADFLQGGNGLNYINPNDIESIDVLKDADATAIYGSAGAYGVILITTKRAKEGAPAFNANIYTGISVNGQSPELLNTQQYLMLRREALANDGITDPPTDNDLNGTWPEDRYTDWRKMFMGGHAANTNINLSYAGGAKTTTYLISGSLRNTGNIQRHKGSNGDGSLRFALNTGTADNKFNLSLTGTYLSSLDDMVPYDFSTSALTPPNAPPAFFPDGSINWASIGSDPNSSGTASNSNRLYKNVTNNLLGNATVVYRPIAKLTLRTIFGYNDIAGKELAGYPTTTFNPTNTQASTQTVGIFHHYDTRSITVAPYAEYNTNLGRKGELSVKLGGEADNVLTYFDDITGTGFPSDALLNDPSAGASVVTDYNLTEYRTIGFYGIIKYIWDKKYIIDINTRRDGSTKFGPGRRFGNFGSVAAAWIFSEENFIKNNAPFISFGKLRGSTGVVGGDALGDFKYLSTYSVIGGAYDTKIGLSPNSLANPYLAWEKNKSSEVGLELGFLNNRIYAEASYYYNKATNQLVEQPLSTVTGYNGYSLNSDAIIRNSGWEMNLNTTNIKTENFTWSTRFNLSIPTSKLLKAPTQKNQNTNFIVGKPITGLLLYKYEGVNPQTGYYSFTNAKGVTDDFTGGLTQADKTEFVDLAPKYYGGFQNTVSYKQLSVDFSFNFTKRTGKTFLGQTSYAFGVYGLNGSTEWLQRWQKPGDITDIPRVSTQLTNFYSRQNLLQNSTGAYGDATYARLQNLNIRYHFKGEFVKKLHLKDLSIYLQGQNLLTISKFGGLDPENLSAGVIPPMRVFTGGLNLTL